MGRTACTEPQCLYKGALYLFTFPTCFGPNDHLDGYNLRPKHVGMFKYLIISNVFYEAALKFGSEAWVLKKREEQRLEAAQMKKTPSWNNKTR